MLDNIGQEVTQQYGLITNMGNAAAPAAVDEPSVTTPSVATPPVTINDLPLELRKAAEADLAFRRRKDELEVEALWQATRAELDRQREQVRQKAERLSKRENELLEEKIRLDARKNEISQEERKLKERQERLTRKRKN